MVTNLLNLLISSACIFTVSLVFSMFGRGGGEFYIPIMLSFLPIDYYTAAGVSLFIIALQGFSMLTIYHGKHKLVDWKLAFLLGSLIGFSSFLGGYMSYRMPDWILKLSFSIFLLTSSYYLYKGKFLKPKGGKVGIWRRNIGNISYNINLLHIVPPIVAVAFVAGMAGISGGGLIVPICILLGGIPTRIAMGTNTFLVLLSSIMSFIGHTIRGGFDVSLGLIYGFAVIIGSQIGSRLHIMISEDVLRKLFSIVLLVAAAWMIIKMFV